MTGHAAVLEHPVPAPSAWVGALLLLAAIVYVIRCMVRRARRAKRRAEARLQELIDDPDSPSP